MEADNIAGGKEPKRLPVWACIPLFIVILFILLGLYGTLARGCLSLVLGVEARHPGVMGYIILEASMLLAVLTAAIPMLRFERRPFSDLGLSLKGHVKGLWYGFLMAILLYLFVYCIYNSLQTALSCFHKLSTEVQWTSIVCAQHKETKHLKIILLTDLTDINMRIARKVISSKFPHGQF